MSFCAKKKQIIELVSERLADKGSGVRRKALEFFVSVLHTHPFHLDGGELSVSFFTEKLQMVEKYVQDVSDQEEGKEKNRQTEILKTQLLYYRDAIDFSQRMSSILSSIEIQLGSDVRTEVVNAIDLVVCCFLYKIAGADSLLRKVFHLVWLQDSTAKEDGGGRISIREHVVSSFIDLFLYSENQDASSVVEGLLQLIDGKTKAEAAAVEQILRLVFQKTTQYLFVIEQLWLVVRDRACSLDRRRCSFVLLQMLTKSNPSSIEENLDLVIHFAFDSQEQLCEYSAKILINLSTGNTKLDANNKLFEKIAVFVKEAHEKDLPATECFLEVIYSVCSNPEDVLLPIVYSLLSSYLSRGQQTTSALNKILFVGSYCALLQSIRLEMLEETVRRKEDKEEEKEEQMRRLLDIRENFLLYSSKSIFSVVSRMAQKLSRDFAGHPVSVQRHLSQTLSRFMCISSVFCRENISILKRQISENKDSAVKCTFLIALGDMAVLYSKIVDENVSILTECLKDTDSTVRLTALLIISRLCLNDFVKLRGQLGVIAMCLDDSDERVRTTAVSLFREIDKKKDVIYNYLLEIIVDLSAVSTEEQFSRISKFIISFIQKESHHEKIIEKICTRLKKEQNAIMQSRLSFCLTLLSYNAKTARYIIDGIKGYSSLNPAVGSNLNSIAKKIAKAQWAKHVESEINSLLVKNGENINTEQREEAKRIRTEQLL